MIRGFLSIVICLTIFGCGTVNDNSLSEQSTQINSNEDQIQNENSFVGVVSTGDQTIASLSEQNITIDLNLLSCINDALFMPKDYMANINELQLITHLECDQQNIYDISILQNLTYLKELNLNNNYITDISPLKNLKYLQVLKLNNNFINDLSPLKDLHDLNELWVYYNQIVDFSYVSHVREIYGESYQVFSKRF